MNHSCACYGAKNAAWKAWNRVVNLSSGCTNLCVTCTRIRFRLAVSPKWYQGPSEECALQLHVSLNEILRNMVDFMTLLANAEHVTKEKWEMKRTAKMHTDREKMVWVNAELKNIQLKHKTRLVKTFRCIWNTITFRIILLKGSHTRRSALKHIPQTQHCTKSLW